MARMEPDLQDARRLAQTLINVQVERHARRWKNDACDYVNALYNEAAAAGKPFDYVAAVREALDHVVRDGLPDIERLLPKGE